VERTNLSLRMSLRTKLAFAFGAVLVVALAGHILVPGRFCGLTLLGDEGQGECLAFIASRIPAARCRVLAAISDEIRGTNNDVVLSEGLKGFVATFACDDIALLWVTTPQAAPIHARQLVAAALTACRNRASFSLGVARALSLPLLPPPDIVDAANRSKCR
jgi:hypothetical protein